MITFRTERPELKELEQAGAVCVHADFSTDAGITAAADTLKDRCKTHFQSIVHNASSWMTDPGGPSDLMNLALMMRIHVGTSMALTEALRNALLKASNPSVINISDHVANRGSDQHMAYAASKSAMLNLTKSQAKKYAPKIRVNALCPALLEFRHDDDASYRSRTIEKSVLHASARIRGRDRGNLLSSV